MLRRKVFRDFESQRTDTESMWLLMIRIEEDTLDGGWIAECLTLPGCVAQGDTREEAVKNLEDAIRSVISVRIDQAMQQAMQGQLPAANEHEFAISV